jgi:hypothetical protein
VRACEVQLKQRNLREKLISLNIYIFKKLTVTRYQWLISVILAKEAEIRRIMVRSQPRLLRPYLKKKNPPKKPGRVAQGVGPEFKPQ